MTDLTSRGRQGVTLVLGGGGAFGVAYIAGVLQALKEAAGIDAAGVATIIGTSAGSVVAAGLRCGDDPADMAASVMEPIVAPGQPAPPSSIVPAWQSPSELVRRAIGSSYSMARTTMPAFRWMPNPPVLAQRVFPNWLFRTAADWDPASLAEDWPEGDTRLVACDLASQRRVVLTAESRPPVSLRQAVLASCAVPGVYEPVVAGGRHLVDGGVHSVTNLDLAAGTGASLVVAICPMGFDPRHPPRRSTVIARTQFNLAVSYEARLVRRRGAAVLLFRPWGDVLAHAGANLLSRKGLDRVFETARASALWTLATPEAADALARAR